MKFFGISKDFSLVGEEQYNTIGKFWDDMAEIYGLENLYGLGYLWRNDMISYAIGLKDGVVDGCNFSMELPDEGWTVVCGRTDDLKEIYDEIYLNGALKYEIEAFWDNGDCEIKFIR